MPGLFTIFEEEPAATQQPTAMNSGFDFPKCGGYKRTLGFRNRDPCASMRSRRPRTMDSTSPGVVPGADPTESPKSASDPSKSGKRKGKAPQKHTGLDVFFYGPPAPSATPATSCSSSDPSGHYYESSVGESTRSYANIEYFLPAPDFNAMDVSGPSNQASISPSLSRAPASWTNRHSHHLQSSSPQPPQNMAYLDTTSREDAFEYLEEYREGQEMPRCVIAYLRTVFTTTADFDKLQTLMTLENFTNLITYERSDEDGVTSENSRIELGGDDYSKGCNDYSDDSEVECLSSRPHHSRSSSVGYGFLNPSLLDSDGDMLPSGHHRSVAPSQGGSSQQVKSSQQSESSEQSESRVDPAPERPSQPIRQVPKFEKFFELPLELRKRIYEMALCTDKEIQPMLCDKQQDGSIKFHNGNGHSHNHPNHNAVSKLLGVTRASKQLRLESLPCFYSVNTFSDSKDITTYFAYLSHLNRFHLIRHVRLTIPLLHECWAVQLLEQMDTYAKDVAKYDAKHVTDGSKFDHTYLVNHPRYIAGGLDSMNLFILLRMLTSAYPSNTSGYTSTLTLPIPSIASFTTYPRLRYFPLTCHGLGMHVHYLEGYEVVQNKIRHITLDWQQKFQKKNFGADEAGHVDVDVRKRTLQMFPNVDAREFRIDNTQYYRSGCDGRTYTWWKVDHCAVKGSGSGVVV